MNSFNFYMPTQVRFGAGRLSELAEVLPSLGSKCLLVSRPAHGSLSSTYERIHDILKGTGISIFHFDKIVPNPTTTGVEEGIMMARQHDVDFVLGVGGGSVMDSAKLIAFLYGSETNIDWKAASETYGNPFAIGESPQKALPFVAVSTTSGSGSQCTQAAVVSDLERKEKVTLFHSGLFPTTSIVDPELMLSVPAGVTAATGFDAFAHAFESFLGSRTSPVTEAMSLEVIRTVFENLPLVMDQPDNLEARSKMAWADTTAGMCLANGGADLPHPLGEIIGGICPRVSHGDTLAIVYPEFLKFKSTLVPQKFKKVERVLDGDSGRVPLSAHVDDLFEKTNLETAFSRASFNSDELELISEHPLLSLLNPDQSQQIIEIMNKSLSL